jgi:HupE / UreJ protein
MSGFIFYFKIGWAHIISLGATDHLYFIAVLSIVYQLADWKKVLVLVTAFTLGHAITLYLSALDLFRFSVEWVEFIIPCTIVLTAAKNLLMPAQSRAGNTIQYAMALGFGAVHGMGYANYIRMMLSSDQQLVWSLFSFNVGLEIGQIFVVLAVLLVSWILHRFNVISHRLLVMLFSLIILGLSLFMAYQRIPFF